MAEKIGIIYYCEGAGHSMRMLAVAQALESHGFTTAMTGGGPGERFLQMQGRSTFSPANIQPGNQLHHRSAPSAIVNLASGMMERVRDLRKWLRHQNPDIVLTDGSAGPIAAVLEQKPYYFVNHWHWSLPRHPLEKITTVGVNRLVTMTSRTFYCPMIWEGRFPKGATPVGPLAPAGDDSDPDVDILVVPTALGSMPEDVTASLERSSHTLTTVGDEDWDPQPSLQPYIEAANVVVCAGYSTIMEAAVAGTPVVIAPFTSEQRGVAELLHSYTGFTRYSGDILEDINNLQPPAPRDNGASEIASGISQDLRTEE